MSSSEIFPAGFQLELVGRGADAAEECCEELLSWALTRSELRASEDTFLGLGVWAKARERGGRLSKATRAFPREESRLTSGFAVWFPRSAQ